MANRAELLAPLPILADLDAAELAQVARPELELLFDFDRELAIRVLRAVIRMLCARLRTTNDSLRSVLAMSMF